MADGVRIQPQPARLRADGIDSVANRLFVVRDVTRPLRPPHTVCTTCGVAHECKTYHLQLDAEGTVIVSTTVWDRLHRLYDHGGFEQVNVVRKPPTQRLVLPPALVMAAPTSM